MLFLSLAIAFTATPARLAEAASDIGRELADADADAGTEEADGGVGDDAGDTIKLDKTQVLAADGMVDCHPEPALPVCAPFRAHHSQAANDPPARAAPSASRRQSLLERYQC
jgi:hypothetical protein